MEATIVCIDNSEWTRSGDYGPTRFQAQADAVNLLAGAKTQANPENTVGVLTMAGKSPRVLVTPTPDLGKVLNSMTGIAIEGDANIATSVQIAQLALKHRQNKNQRQRIVIFAGSPVQEDKVWGVHGAGGGGCVVRGGRLCARASRAAATMADVVMRRSATRAAHGMRAFCGWGAVAGAQRPASVAAAARGGGDGSAAPLKQAKRCSCCIHASMAHARALHSRCALRHARGPTNNTDRRAGHAGEDRQEAEEEQRGRGHRELRARGGQ
jgi:hypothetical protein